MDIPYLNSAILYNVSFKFQIKSCKCSNYKREKLRIAMFIP